MTSLETTSESLGKDEIKLTVSVPEKALQPALDQVYRRWANEIKVPGFRKGKVPRQLIEARVGIDAIREEALREALPGFYREAVQAEDIDPIASPDIEVTQWEVGAPLIFEATIATRPDIELPDLAEVKIEAPPSEVTEEELDDQLDRLRDRFAELDTVGRPAQRGDHVLIDLKGYRNTELVEGASAPDFLYEVGSQTGPPSLDEQLEGEKSGAILKFNDQIPGSDEELSFTVLVKEVKAKRLPELDDAFAKTVGEFDSLDALKDDLRTRMADYKVALVEEQIHAMALEAFVDASDLVPPDRLVEDEFEHRLHHIEDDLRRAGMSLAQYAEQVGSTELEVRSDMREQAQRSVKAELLLEEIARRQEFEVTQEDLGREVALVAARSGRDPQEVAEQLVSEGRLSAVAADIIRRKAISYIAHNIVVE
ncbi:MAG: trigger factor, partial [Actinomycetota bacterium]